MEDNNMRLSTNRRSFLGAVATGAATLSLGTLAVPLQALAKDSSCTALTEDDPDAWFGKIKGKHRMVFDATEPTAFFHCVAACFFNHQHNDRHAGERQQRCRCASPRSNAVALNSNLWAKYKFGDMLK